MISILALASLLTLASADFPPSCGKPCGEFCVPTPCDTDHHIYRRNDNGIFYIPGDPNYVSTLSMLKPAEKWLTKSYDATCFVSQSKCVCLIGNLKCASNGTVFEGMCNLQINTAINATDACAAQEKKYFPCYTF